MKHELPRYVVKSLKGFHGYLVKRSVFSGDYVKFLQNLFDNEPDYSQYVEGYRKFLLKAAKKNVADQEFNSGLKKLGKKLAYSSPKKKKKKGKPDASPKIPLSEIQAAKRLKNYQQFTQGQPLLVTGCKASLQKCVGFDHRENEYLDNVTK